MSDRNAPFVPTAREAARMLFNLALDPPSNGIDGWDVSGVYWAELGLAVMRVEADKNLYAHRLAFAESRDPGLTGEFKKGRPERCGLWPEHPPRDLAGPDEFEARITAKAAARRAGLAPSEQPQQV